MHVIYNDALRPRILKGSFLRSFEGSFQVRESSSDNLKGSYLSFLKDPLRYQLKIIERSSLVPQGSQRILTKIFVRSFEGSFQDLERSSSNPERSRRNQS